MGWTNTIKASLINSWRSRMAALRRTALIQTKFSSKSSGKGVGFGQGAETVPKTGVSEDAKGTTGPNAPSGRYRQRRPHSADSDGRNRRDKLEATGEAQERLGGGKGTAGGNLAGATAFDRSARRQRALEGWVSMSKLDLEISKNFKAFRAIEPTLLPSNRGKYALIRSEKVVGLYDTIRDAQLTGHNFFEDGLFSVQKIGDGARNLGFFSYALRVASAQ